MFDNNDNDDMAISDVHSAARKAKVAPPDFKTNAILPSLPQPKFELVDGLNQCDNAAYHADRKYLSSSVLKTVLESLEKYHNDYILGLKPETSSSSQNNFDVGTLLHSMILEPETVETEFNYYKGMRKAGSEFDTFIANCKNPKLPVISINQRKVAQDCMDAFTKHNIAKSLIRNGAAEQTICGTLHGVPIKTRFDWINVSEGYIADVKSTGYGSDLESFKATIENFKYGLSAALYTAMAEQYYGRKFDFYYIVLSKRDKTCDVYITSTQTMAAGKTKVRQACEKYLLAKETNVWKEIADSSIIKDTETDSATTTYKIEEV